jgi:hypothetical protein
MSSLCPVENSYRLARALEAAKVSELGIHCSFKLIVPFISSLLPTHAFAFAGAP